MDFDDNQRRAIECDKNCVVTAGAGSGKTTVLAARFLHLVTKKHYNVDEILTLTFTKKAATEMAARIYQKLSQSDEAKAKIATKDFFKANIKTLDSYCAYVARLGCASYGISRDFFIDDNAVTLAVKSLSNNFIIAHKDNNSLRAIVGTKDYCAVGASLFCDLILQNSTVVNPIDFRGFLKKQESYIKDKWEKSSRAALTSSLEVVSLLDNGGCKQSGSLYKRVRAVLDKAGEVPSQPDIIALFNGDDDDKIKGLIDYTMYFHTVSKVALTGEKALISDSIKELRKITTTLKALGNYIISYQTTRGLFTLLEEFQNIVNDYKRRTAVLNYADVSSLALSILKNDKEIRLSEKKKYRAIMIDEFQDNNSAQRDMLFLLSEELTKGSDDIPKANDLVPNKLFFVGDEKQSIYRFRGADVSVFKNLARSFPSGILTLDTNYRSKRVLIDAFNAIFGGVNAVFFTNSNKELSKDFDAVYNDTKCDPKKMGDDDNAPKIHIALYELPKKGDKSDKGGNFGPKEEARYVAGKIASLINSGVSPQDIAILIRKYPQQNLYERTLLENGIPYNSAVVTSIFSDGVVNDFFALLFLISHPTDTAAFTQYLTSPLVGLDIAVAGAIVKNNIHDKDDNKRDFNANDIFNEDFPYKKARDFYNSVKEYCVTHSICETLTFLWYVEGMRYSTLWNKKVVLYKKLYDLLFEAAVRAQNDGLSMGSFIDSLVILRKKRLDDMDIPLPALMGVNIMTIHKSKGLEWPYVFVVGTGERGASNSNTDTMYYSKEFGPSINISADASAFGRDSESRKNYFFSETKKGCDAESEAELRRLTYVALTRAKDEVFITNGNYKKNDDAATLYDVARDRSCESSNPVNTIYSTLFGALNYLSGDKSGNSLIDICNIEPLDSTVDSQNYDRGSVIERVKPYYNGESIDESDSCAPLWHYIYPSKLDDNEKYLIEHNNYYSNESDEKGLIEGRKGQGESCSDNTKKYAATFGTLCHRAFQNAVMDEEFFYSAKEYEDLGSNRATRDKRINDCMESVKAFRESDIFKKAKSSCYYRSEFSFLMRDGDAIIKGAIDLIYKNDDGTYNIIDYKTDKSIDPSRHKKQLGVYRDAVSKIFNIQKDSIHCFLYYTRYNKTCAISID